MVKSKDDDIINFEAAKLAANNDMALMRDLLTIFVESLTDETAQIIKAYQNEKWEELRDYVHKLNGAARYCGALRLIKMCEQFDATIRSKNKDKMDKDYEQLLAEIVDVKNYLDKTNFNDLK